MTAGAARTGIPVTATDADWTAWYARASVATAGDVADVPAAQHNAAVVQLAALATVVANPLTYLAAQPDGTYAPAFPTVNAAGVPVLGVPFADLAALRALAPALVPGLGLAPADAAAETYRRTLLGALLWASGALRPPGAPAPTADAATWEAYWTAQGVARAAGWVPLAVLGVVVIVVALVAYGYVHGQTVREEGQTARHVADLAAAGNEHAADLAVFRQTGRMPAPGPVQTAVAASVQQASDAFWSQLGTAAAGAVGFLGVAAGVGLVVWVLSQSGSKAA